MTNLNIVVKAFTLTVVLIYFVLFTLFLMAAGIEGMFLKLSFAGIVFWIIQAITLFYISKLQFGMKSKGSDESVGFGQMMLAIFLLITFVLMAGISDGFRY